jgi:hypothetical protein
MFLISYTQVGNRVQIHGFNPSNPADTFEDCLVFANVNQAKGYCSTIEAIEAAIRSVYSGQFVLAVYQDVVDITKMKKRKLSMVLGRY